MTLSVSPARTQNECCHRSSANIAAEYCEDCNKPLLRCMAFEECGGLLDDQGRCHICVAPELLLETGAVSAVRVGGAISLPLKFHNASAVKRPLFVTGLWKREDNDTEWHEVKLPWERLNQHQKAPASVVADAMEKVGTHTIEILMAVSTRWRWREESFAFVTNFTLTAEENDSSGGTNISIQGENIGAGAMIHVGKLNDGTDAKPANDLQDQELGLTRADSLEVEHGLRGMENGVRVPRSVRIVWKGFGPGEAPIDGPAVTSDGVLAIGRAKTKSASGVGDVRLLLYAPDGSLDEDASVNISRHHFDLYIEKSCLMLRVNSQNGLRVNGQTYTRGKSVQLDDGDIIAPLVRAQNAISIRVDFEVNHKSVSEVVLTRSPAMPGGSAS